MNYPQAMKFKEWKDQLTITNIENLPAGLKCNYLVLIAGENNTLVAKAWKRKRPVLNNNEYLLVW